MSTLRLTPLPKTPRALPVVDRPGEPRLERPDGRVVPHQERETPSARLTSTAMGPLLVVSIR